ncbi:S41 family peptidase [Candidatus Omnitrophota bacterium]
MSIKSKFMIGLSVVLIVFSAVIMVEAEEATIIDNAKELFKEIQIFADSITLISTDYVEPIKVKDLVYGAIRGMMDTLDGYSQFLDPDSFREITEETKGEFGGLGIEIGVRDGVLTVIAPIEGTPAAEAGFQAGDMIVKIDDKVTRDMTLDDAVKILRGDPGTEVTLTVIREDVDELLEFKVTRAIIKLKSIKAVKIIEEDIGYIKIEEFQERTAKDLRRNIKDLKGKGAKSLIVDVRNNPGGLLESAVEVSDQFLVPGTLIVYTEGRDPKKRKEFKSKKRSDFDDMALIVLVNKGSASAAEIFAGAIKDNKRGMLVGVTTFGKGSVQTVIPLKDESALRLTTAAYYTPSGKTIRKEGVDPNIYVKRERPKKKKAKENEKELKEKKKAEVFKKVKKEEKKKKEEAEEEKKKEGKKFLREDNQLQAAVNILKGIQIFEDYKTVQPVEAEAEEKETQDE